MSKMWMQTGVLAGVLAMAGGVGRAATYYVDFDGGKDGNSGTEVGAAWKHAPGDKDAEGNAKKAVLAAGDKVVFKGGVLYRGSIVVKSSGEADKPIVLDGNSEGKFGEGRAVIEGAEQVTGWQVCKSAEECGGNPNWKHIYVGFAPKGTGLFTVNLCEGQQLLKIAEDPNVEDAFYQEEVRSFVPTTPPLPHLVSDVEVTQKKGMEVNKARPLQLMVDGEASTSAVLSPMVGAEVTFKLPKEATIAGFGIGQGKGYQLGKDFVLTSAGKEIFKGTLKESGGMQKFTLSEPSAVKDLTLKIENAWNEKPTYGAVTEIQAYDAKGVNVLKANSGMEYVRADYFTQKDPAFWDGAYLAIMAKPNWLHYQKVTGYVPEEHKIRFETLTEELYDPKVHPEAARFAMFNAKGILDQAGEYWFNETPDADGTHRVLLWPMKETADGPQGITASVRKTGISVEGGNYVTIEGFKFEKQSGDGASGINAASCSHLVIRNNDVTLLSSGLKRGGAVGGHDIENGLIEGNTIELNRRLSGIMFSRFNNSVAQGNTLRKNGSTAVDYYDCHHSKLLKNVVTEHNGVHANGLTMYAGCEDILVEGNKVLDSNVCLTMQDGSDIVVRNNILDGHGSEAAIGLWSGKPLKNITIVNNVCAHAAPNHEWQGSIYCGNTAGSGFVIKNNVIDGLAGDGYPADTVFANNIYTQMGPWQKKAKKELGAGEKLEPDVSKIFVDAAKMDFHLKAGSPAIGAGADVGVKTDFDGTPAGKAPDIGAFTYKP